VVTFISLHFKSFVLFWCVFVFVLVALLGTETLPTPSLAGEVRHWKLWHDTCRLAVKYDSLEHIELNSW